MPLAITRTDYSIAELRGEACRCENSGQARRLLGLAMALEGATRETAAKVAGMTRQTLRDWVIRYNEASIAGLKDKPKPGRPPRLQEAQLVELDAVVEKVPISPSMGWCARRCVDLKAIIASKFGVDLSEDQIGRILKQRGYRRLSGTPASSADR